MRRKPDPFVDAGNSVVVGTEEDHLDAASIASATNVSVTAAPKPR